MRALITVFFAVSHVCARVRFHAPSLSHAWSVQAFAPSARGCRVSLNSAATSPSRQEVAVVTGANRGLGLAIAKELACSQLFCAVLVTARKLKIFAIKFARPAAALLASR